MNETNVRGLSGTPGVEGGVLRRASEAAADPHTVKARMEMYISVYGGVFHSLGSW